MQSYKIRSRTHLECLTISITNDNHTNKMGATPNSSHQRNASRNRVQPNPNSTISNPNYIQTNSSST